MFLLRSPLFLLICFWALVIYGHSWEAHLKQDSMTYSAVAKNMVQSGDWTVPTYTPSTYKEFFQHPPLGLWMQATVFKFFGATEWTARIFPGLMSLGTVLGVFALGWLIGTKWIGFLAGLILLTTTRYVKYAGDFFLDGPLVFWLIWSIFLFLWIEKGLRKKKPNSWLLGYSALAGFAFFCAFMTKGVVAFADPLACGIYLAWLGLRREKIFPKFVLLSVFQLVVVGLLLGLWGILGDGFHFLQEYWIRSVAPRASANRWDEHFAPMISLLKTYWPWLPMFLLALWANLRDGKWDLFFRRPLGLVALMAAIVFGAFSYSGHFLEHYLVPFYPFAAILGATQLAAWTEKKKEKILGGFRVFVLVLAIVLATLPIRLHSKRAHPLKPTAQYLAENCRGPLEIFFTPSVSERWAGLAILLWFTDFEAAPIQKSRSPRNENQILLLESEGPAAPGWEKVETPTNVPHLVFQPTGTQLCNSK